MAAPATCKLCLLALPLVCIGWVVGIVAEPEPGLVGILAAGSSGVTLAILGIFRVRRSPSLRGLKLACAALGLGLGLFVLGGVQLVRVLASRVPLAATRSASPRDALTGKLLPVRLKAYNLVYQPPGSPWRRIDHARFHPAAVLGFARADPAIIFVLVAETPGIERGLTTRSILDSAEALRGGQAAAKLLEQKLLRVGGVEGVRWLTEATVGEQRMRYVQWGCARNGFAYQLLVWGDQAHARQVAESAARLFAGFSLIDPSRIVHVASGPRAIDVRSPRFGYQMRFAQTAWAIQPDPAAGNASADTFARVGQQLALVVMPLDLHGLDPPLGLLGRMLLGLLELPQQPWRREVLGGRLVFTLALSHSGKDGVRYHYRIRVFKRAGTAYLMVGWSRAALAAKLLDAGLSRFVPIDHDRRRPLTPRERTAHGRAFSRIGILHYKARRLAEAARWLRRGFEFEQSDPVMLENLIRVYCRQGKRVEARVYLRRHIGRFPGNEALAALLQTLD